MSYQTIKGVLGTLRNAHRLLRSVAEERKVYLYKAIKQASVYRHQMLVRSSRTKDSASYVHPRCRKPPDFSSYDMTDLLRTFISVSGLIMAFRTKQHAYLCEHANPSIHPSLSRPTQLLQTLLAKCKTRWPLLRTHICPVRNTSSVNQHTRNEQIISHTYVSNNQTHIDNTTAKQSNPTNRVELNSTQ